MSRPSELYQRLAIWLSTAGANMYSKKILSLMGASNPTANPLRLINNAGGNFSGFDVVTNANKATNINAHQGRLVFRYDSPSTMAMSFFIDSNVAGTQAMWIQQQTTNIEFKAYSSNGHLSTISLPLGVVGTIYDIKWDAVCGSGSPSLTIDVNGNIYTGNDFIGYPAANLMQIGSTSNSGLGKIVYMLLYRDSLKFEYAPSVYGVAGTTNCGNGWTLTDGSPSTFWANYGQSFPLLTQGGGYIAGNDSITLPTSGAVSAFTLKMTYQHKVTPGTSAGILISTDDSARGFSMLVNAGQTAIRCYMYSGGGNRAWLDIPVLIGVVYDIELTGDGDTGANPTLSALVNGVAITSAGIIAGTTLTNTRLIGGVGAINCKIPFYIETRDGVLQPVYTPATYGVTGTNDAGNGWALTDGSPTTFWS